MPETTSEKMEVLSSTQLKITKSVEEIIDKDKLIREQEILTEQISRLQEQLNGVNNLLNNFK